MQTDMQIEIDTTGFSFYNIDSMSVTTKQGENQMNREELRNEMYAELKKSYGEGARFRDGQEEVILGVLEGKKSLVVQKTGWGKSLVYFMAAKILRKQGKGFALIVSPLLALMNNQIESAGKLNLCVKTVNSENSDEWSKIMDDLKDNKVDALIISPERLSNEDFRERLNQLGEKIGLFVVDEAHCISDWGHDFRPDYRRIVNVITSLPSNIPVLATTATANDRVVEDIKAQLGNDIQISRGGLMRESLAIQVVRLASKPERMAWLAKNIKDLPGTGIIYCLTVNDCILVDSWLRYNDIRSECYYAGLEKDSKAETVNRFMRNEIKVLVATVAFGMGFDKPDISFVIHFQKPGNIVSYYQQIGRAGRSLENAYAILMCGGEDDDINEYFIASAFPTEDLMNEVVETTANHDGLKLGDYEKFLNMKRGKIEKCVKYLEVNGDIYKENGLYYKTPRPWAPNLEKSEKITAIRREELKQMDEYTRIQGCYMEYIAKCLDDPTAVKCGKCSNCVDHPLIDEEISAEDIAQASRFIKERFDVIEPRKYWPSGIRIDDKNKILESYLCSEGRVLSNYGDGGWGKAVAEGKYRQGHFSDELVEASCNLLRSFVQEKQIQWVTSIPSLRHPELVKDFAKRLAAKLGLPYLEVLAKTQDARPQKELNNSNLQWKNAYESFEARGEIRNGNVLLVDDMVDSKWTFTCCGYILRKQGSGEVFPFALASSAGRNGDD